MPYIFGDKMDKFQLSIESLKYGWADLLLLINNQEKTFCFENVPNDPLSNLLESAIKIISNMDSTIIFHNGMKKEYLLVKKTENNLCRIETDCIYPELSVKQFTKAILRMFDTYIFAFSRDEYDDNWSAFPEKELERLRTLYHTL